MDWNEAATDEHGLHRSEKDINHSMSPSDLCNLCLSVAYFD